MAMQREMIRDKEGKFVKPAFRKERKVDPEKRRYRAMAKLIQSTYGSWLQAADVKRVVTEQYRLGKRIANKVSLEYRRALKNPVTRKR